MHPGWLEGEEIIGSFSFLGEPSLLNGFDLRHACLGIFQSEYTFADVIVVQRAEPIRRFPIQA